MRPALLLVLAACATASTPASIARQLDGDLRFLAQRDAVLRVRCESVLRAQKKCLAIGELSTCAWDGWVDEDHDSFVIAACQERQRRGMEVRP
jgi:hypothetical protein